jgi:hypothetical protein
MSDNPYLDELRALENGRSPRPQSLKTIVKQGFEGFEGAQGSAVAKFKHPEGSDVGCSRTADAARAGEGFDGFEGAEGSILSKIEAHHESDLGSSQAANSASASEGFEGFESSQGTPFSKIVDRESGFKNEQGSTSDTIKTLKTAAADVRFAYANPTAAERAKWAGAADQIVKVLGRHQRGDISRRRWQRMVADVRQFVEGGWAHRAYRLGWHSLVLLGVDRKAPWARHDRRGLVLSLDGNKVVEVTELAATLETNSGARLTYPRRPIEFNDVLLVDQIAPAHRAAIIKPAWTEVLGRLERCRVPQDVSPTRWQQYRSDLRRLAEGYWDFMPFDFMDWDGSGPFPARAKRALAWVIGGCRLTSLTRDTAVCGKAVFRRLPGDQGWQAVTGPYPDSAHESVAKWLD